MQLYMNLMTFTSGIQRIDGLPAEFHDPINDCFDQACTLITQKLNILEDQLRRANRVIFGSKSERYDVPGQQCIGGVSEQDNLHTAMTLDDVLAATDEAALRNDSVPAHVAHAQHKAADKLRAQKEKKSTGGGRAVFPAWLEEIKRTVALPESERLDAHGYPLPCIGYKTSKSLGYQGAQYFIDVEERAVYGKPFDEDVKRVVTPSTLMYEKSTLSNSLIAYVVHAKFHDHLPLYRIEQHLETAGLNTFTRQKMGRALIQVALDEKMQCVCDAINAEILAQPVVQIDDTTCRMLNPDNKKCQITRFWALTNGKNAWYRHSLTRAGHVCFDILKNYAGHVQCDDYAGHNSVFIADERIRVACMAHIRRKFEESLGESFAEAMVRLIQSLYAIETYLKESDAPEDDKDEHRHLYARPILIHLYAELDKAVASALYTPKSSLGRAISYAIKQRAAMFEYLEHGFLDIDNNNCERAMRRIALGRKNYLFVGNEDGGKTVATWCTITETCRRHLINAEEYLNWLFTKLKEPGVTQIDYAALTPSMYDKIRERPESNETSVDCK